MLTGERTGVRRAVHDGAPVRFDLEQVIAAADPVTRSDRDPKLVAEAPGLAPGVQAGEQEDDENDRRQATFVGCKQLGWQGVPVGYEGTEGEDTDQNQPAVKGASNGLMLRIGQDSGPACLLDRQYRQLTAISADFALACRSGRDGGR